MNSFRSLIADKAGSVAAPPVIHLPDTRVMEPAPCEQSPLDARKLWCKRLLLGLAAIAVPAMAAPGDFGALPGAASSEDELPQAIELTGTSDSVDKMPFEEPGMSFPGSAFFFLADPPAHNLIALPANDPLENGSGEAGHEVGALIDAGPAARPFFSAASSHLQAEECLAQAIWYEAASESEAGQRAVAQVVLNRVAHSSWPGSVCGVVYQGSQRSTGCQFTFTCDGSLRRSPRGKSWARARTIAGEALSGSVYAPIGHATHYHTLWVSPYWASSLDHVGTIGAHRFYSNRGTAGDKSAFSTSYSGVEPGVRGRGLADDSDPAVVAAVQSETVVKAAQSEVNGVGPTAEPTSISPESQLTEPALSGVGQVRPDFARAGQWRSDAARAALGADEEALANEEAEASVQPPAP
ncbi:MAG: cell wall hydrolase [Pseudomonadota bacterium]